MGMYWHSTDWPKSANCDQGIALSPLIRQRNLSADLDKMAKVIADRELRFAPALAIA